MPRDISTPLRYSLERQETGEALIVFLTVSHPDVAVPIQVAADAVDYVWNGEVYTGIPFPEITLVSDGDGPPTAKLSMQNVDRRIGEAVRGLASPPRLRIDLIAASLFDETQNPRTPLDGEPEPDYTADHLFLANVRGDDFLEGDIMGWNYVQEVWPGIRATQNRLPGLYR